MQPTQPQRPIRPHHVIVEAYHTGGVAVLVGNNHGSVADLQLPVGKPLVKVHRAKISSHLDRIIVECLDGVFSRAGRLPLHQAPLALKRDDAVRDALVAEEGMVDALLHAYHVADIAEDRAETFPVAWNSGMIILN